MPLPLSFELVAKFAGGLEFLTKFVHCNALNMHGCVCVFVYGIVFIAIFFFDDEAHALKLSSACFFPLCLSFVSTHFMMYSNLLLVFAMRFFVGFVHDLC